MKNFRKALEISIQESQKTWAVKKIIDTEDLMKEVYWELQQVRQDFEGSDYVVFTALDREAAIDHCYVILGIHPDLIKVTY